MSRYIKSAKTLKARVGKQVKVDGTLCDVTERRGSIIFEAVDGGYHAEVDNIEAFLSDHDVATAGYKFKHTCAHIKGYIMDKECKITVACGEGNYDESEEHTVIGMLRFCEDAYGETGYMMLTNDAHFKGCNAKDKKGYKYSWWLSKHEDVFRRSIIKTQPLEKPEEYVYTNSLKDLPLNKPVKVIFRDYQETGVVEGMFKVCHLKDNSSTRVFFLSNSSMFDGCESCREEREGYQYSWSMAPSKTSKETSYPFCIVKSEEVSKKPKEELVEKTFKLTKYHGSSEFLIVKGVLYTDPVTRSTYLLSNDDNLDGGHEDVCERSDTGYEYGWWLVDSDKDISESMYKITEVTEEEPKCAEGCCESGSCSGDTLVRIAEALERIAKALEK